MTERALPCPMCGGAAGEVRELVEGSVWSMHCASGLVNHDASAMSWTSAEHCIKTWNQRAPSKSSFQHWVDEQEGNGPDAPSVGGKEGDIRSLVEMAIADIQMFDLPDDDGHLAAAESGLWKVLAALSASQEGAEG